MAAQADRERSRRARRLAIVRLAAQAAVLASTSALEPTGAQEPEGKRRRYVETWRGLMGVGAGGAQPFGATWRPATRSLDGKY
eukprot:scaffold191358_cov46-Tisochrysis_lutea.AAC.1